MTALLILHSVEADGRGRTGADRHGCYRAHVSGWCGTQSRNLQNKWREALIVGLAGFFGPFLGDLVIGVPGALYVGRLLGNLHYGVVSYDPFALAGAVLVLGLCATVAGFIPARAAASIEPMRALRTE